MSKSIIYRKKMLKIITVTVVKEQKMNYELGKKCLQNHMSDKVLVSKIHKGLSNEIIIKILLYKAYIKMLIKMGK